MQFLPYFGSGLDRTLGPANPACRRRTAAYNLNVNEPALYPKNEGFGQKTRTFDARSPRSLTVEIVDLTVHS